MNAAPNFLNDIRDANLSYLVLAQTMIREDKPEAMYRLGLAEPVADMIGQMSPQQLVRVASRNGMLCSLRFEDELIWGLLTDRHEPADADEAAASRNADRLHASVLMAGRHAGTAVALAA